MNDYNNILNSTLIIDNELTNSIQHLQISNSNNIINNNQIESNSSTNNANNIITDEEYIWCLFEAMRVSNNLDVELLLVAIDASKAFDKVNRMVLYCILIDYLPAMLVMTLINYYGKSRSKVRFSSFLSNKTKV